jgi:CrcB protein
VSPTEPGSFPTITLILNVGGSFFLGTYLSRRERSVMPALSLQFVAIGVLGSLTTFSTFSVETFQLMNAGRASLVLAYSGASIVGGLAAALVGDRIGRMSRWR